MVSPDGTKIAFTSTRDGGGDLFGREIYVMDADGSNPTRLTDNDRVDVEPNWSPDGSKIVFMSFGTTGTPDIFVMDADGSNQVNITDDPSVVDLSPVWITSVATAIKATSWGKIKLNTQ